MQAERPAVAVAAKTQTTCGLDADPANIIHIGCLWGKKGKRLHQINTSKTPWCNSINHNFLADMMTSCRLQHAQQDQMSIHGGQLWWNGRLYGHGHVRDACHAEHEQHARYEYYAQAPEPAASFSAELLDHKLQSQSRS